MHRGIRIHTKLRYYTTKCAPKNPIKYTDTINIPKTKFPNRLSPNKRDEVEQRLLQGIFARAYRYQESHNREPAFVLHDGPPYANGDLHMGHAVNKILKDITLRQHVVKGEKVNYIPGWDCHGLPIELKAMANAHKNSSEKSKEIDATSIRQKCRAFALETVQRQKQEFVSWGILSDWSNASNVYLTLSPQFIVNQLKMFLDFYDKRLAFRELKPVYWSPSSKTALAEAELEYDTNFKSPSTYLRCTITKKPKSLQEFADPLYALIWTTTPWTLPSNQAICFNSSLEYSVVQLNNDTESMDGLYLLATSLINEFESTTKTKCQIIKTISGQNLTECTYKHPVDSEQIDLPFFAASHVQDNKGTGLVHTAPAHGPDDFLISLENKLPIRCFVDEEGTYTQDAPAFLRGKSVLREGNKLMLDYLAKDVIFNGEIVHSYPIDWRTKEPVIIRASKQWFLNTDLLKDRAIQEIENISMFPSVNAVSSRNALETQIRKRPYWCISRQRVWGVPIPVFYNKRTGKEIVNRSLIEHIYGLVEKEGNIDFWWSWPIEDIIPENLLSTELHLKYDELEKGGDIFDIWFDSGSSWSSVLHHNADQKADLYLEGYDQFTGWFQSSLLTSMAARNAAPYKALFVHGFTVDEKGHKMSKSLGNVISPRDITKKFGTDVLRLWVASHASQHMSITVSDKLLQQTAESLSKIRSILRYLNGCIGSKREERLLDLNHNNNNNNSNHLNQYLLSCLVNFNNEIERFYTNYEYNRVVAHTQNFVANQVSAIYLHLIKDRLYCGNDNEVLAVEFVLLNCYKALCKALWPITPFLIEENWNYYDSDRAFYENSTKVDESWRNPQTEEIVNTTLQVKRLVNQMANNINTWSLAVEIFCSNSQVLNALKMMQSETNSNDSELCEALQVQSIKLMPGEERKAAAPVSDSSIEATSTSSLVTADSTEIRIEPLDILLCARCRRFAVQSENTICSRCTNVLKSK